MSERSVTSVERSGTRAAAEPQEGEFPVCPHCNHKLTETPVLVEETYAPAFHVLGRPLPTRGRSATFLTCSVCEYAEEVKA